jgi:hypothetical protein
MAILLLRLRTLRVYAGTLHVRMGTLHVRMGTLHVRMGTLHVRTGTLHVRMETLQVKAGSLHVMVATLHVRVGVSRASLDFLHLLAEVHRCISGCGCCFVGRRVSRNSFRVARNLMTFDTQGFNAVQVRGGSAAAQCEKSACVS